MSWAQSEDGQLQLKPGIRNAIRTRKEHLRGIRARKRDTISAGRLNPISFDKDSFLRSIPSHVYARFPTEQEYPSPNLFICESEAIYDRNTSFLFRRTLADRRIARKFVQTLDVSKLQHDVCEEESGIFFDENDMVMVVIRNACPVQELVDFVDATICKIVETRNHIRVRRLHVLMRD